MARGTATADRSGLEPQWIRPKVFRELTGMTNSAMHRALHDGSLRAVQVGRTWYIHGSELETYFRRTGRTVAGRNAA